MGQRQYQCRRENLQAAPDRSYYAAENASNRKEQALGQSNDDLVTLEDIEGTSWGDLLSSLLRVSPEFWKDNPMLWRRLAHIVDSTLDPLPGKILNEYDQFRAAI